MNKAVIFDMDGVLIDSEPLWKIAEHEVFSSLGVKVSDELSAQTAALTTTEVTEFWYQYMPWKGMSKTEAEYAVIHKVCELIQKKGEVIEGVYETLKLFKNLNYKIGLATNSTPEIIEIVLNKLNITDYFDAISSAQEVEKGKPHPEVYLSCAKKLNMTPEHCLVFEDSRTGLKAAKAAGMTTVFLDRNQEYNRDYYGLVDLRIESYNDFSSVKLQQLLPF